MAMTGEGVYASLSPATFVFSNTYYDEANNQTVMITNNSDVSFGFSNIAVVNDTTGSFSINNLETLLGAGEMAPGDSLSLSLTYQPKVLHEAWTHLNAENKFMISADGDYGADNYPVLALSGQTQGRSEISITPLSHDFGEVMVGETSLQTFNISNTGTGLLTLNEVCFLDGDDACLSVANVSGFFSFETVLPNSLAPGASIDWIVQYAPTGSQDGAPLETAQIRIKTNDEQNPSVTTDIDETEVNLALQGKAINPDSSLSWPGDFGPTLVYGHDWIYQTLTITNDGTGDLVLTDIRLLDGSVAVGADPEFILIEPSNFTIGENESRDIGVGFRPTGGRPS